MTIETQEHNGSGPDDRTQEQLPDAGGPVGGLYGGPYGVPYTEREPTGRGPLLHETVIYRHVETQYSERQRESTNHVHQACGAFGIKSTNLMADGPANYSTRNPRLKNTTRPSGSVDSCCGCGQAFSICTPNCNVRIYAVFFGHHHRARAAAVCDRLNAYNRQHGFIPQYGDVPELVCDIWDMFQGFSTHETIPDTGPVELERAMFWGLG